MRGIIGKTEGREQLAEIREQGATVRLLTLDAVRLR
jgi:hypothetical protein